MSNDLDDFMRGLAAETVKHPLLETMRLGQATVGTWAEYIRERLRTIDVDETMQSPSRFERFLEEAIRCAREQRHESLALAFEKNLKEERGIGKDGEIVDEEVHALWRSRFRARMQAVLEQKGVNSSLFLAPSNPSTLTYNSLLEEFMGQMRDGQLFEAAGAMCALEGIIRDEYERVVHGLTATFPELASGDRRYIDDHAEHDEHHYLWIRAALDRILEATSGKTRDEVLAALQRGAARIAQAKKSFFDGIQLVR